MADEVSIPVSLLEEMRDTVTTAHHYHQTVDLGESYRKLQGTPQWSKLTNKLAASMELLQYFIELAAQEMEESNGDGLDESNVS